ncbi:hypothetical protein GE300_15925 [Rhodobacteraceae bacterium 2CG4]|uniref:Uncharacterized protein n=1 Tax=Halovulum marinum TaxID=2662447 RepID=A0A6L5Z3F3_9RHOB|nr:hypothetical protein [Halovulum marinum]MSU91078.1 hypothetical protein [Halovulum marinum]
MSAAGNPGAFLFAVLVLGSAAALAALILRRAEARHPDPDDTQVRGGLAHMVVGILAWFGIVSFVLISVAFGGVLVPLALWACAWLGASRVDFGRRLVPFYRLQMSFAAAATLAALILWLTTINTMQGVPNA